MHFIEEFICDCNPSAFVGIWTGGKRPKRILVNHRIWQIHVTYERLFFGPRRVRLEPQLQPQQLSAQNHLLDAVSQNFTGVADCVSSRARDDLQYRVQDAVHEVGGSSVCWRVLFGLLLIQASSVCLLIQGVLDWGNLTKVSRLVLDLDAVLRFIAKHFRESSRSKKLSGPRSVRRI